MTNPSCMRCFVAGKVQGVWYRASAKEEAFRLGITGWARNLKDGRVEIFACGEVDKLNLFYAWIKKGPRLARVEEHSREDLPWQDYQGFDSF
ncbi:acylphosphatase [Legionella sp. MW5194]|uniref:acylphosphatase n=1 Tax=Legionella sp. MW5194 TaxID=2662448 RepID=UPI00193D7131|nr:acylphosphatase [Legionella sp. MW5194]QRN03055.1 acylphosphatase [Legionella sp. MW5194]